MYERFVQHFSATSTELFTKIIILPISLIGLANRLRVIAGALAAARLYQAHVYVSWHSDAACNATFRSLFTLSPDAIHYLTVIDVKEPCKTNHACFDSVSDGLAPLVEQQGQSWLVYRPTQFFLHEKIFSIANVTFLFTRAMHAVEDSSCKDFLETKRWFYSGLKAGESVKEFVSALQTHSPFWQRPTKTDKQENQTYHSTGRPLLVGLHIRVHENMHDWAMVAPQQSTDMGSNSDNYSNDNGSINMNIREIDNFASMNSMDHSIESIDVKVNTGEAETFALSVSQSLQQQLLTLKHNLLQTHANVLFFITSNNMLVKQELLQLLGEDICLTLLSSEAVFHERHSPYAVQLAAAEFLLLAQSQLIIHSHASSFAREAAATHSIPVLDIVSMISKETEETEITEGGLLPTHSSGKVSHYWVLSLSPNSQPHHQPHCALPEFIRSQRLVWGNQEQSNRNGGQLYTNTEALTLSNKYCYSETGGREMCSLRYWLCPCTTQQNVFADNEMRLLESISAYCPVSVGSEATLTSQCFTLLAESTGHSV